jgi:hypothetical protein
MSNVFVTPPKTVHIQDQTESATSLQTPQAKLELLVVPQRTQRYIIFAHAELKNDSIAFAEFIKVELDGSPILELEFDPTAAGRALWSGEITGVEVVNLTQGVTHSIKLYFWSENVANTVYIRNATLIARPLV